MKNLILSAVVILTVFAGGCGSDKKETDKPATTMPPAKKQVTTQSSNYDERIVSIKTTMGVIKVKLYNQTPAHRDNFVQLVKRGFYSDLLFHRVIKNFMVQGGDPDSKDADPGQMLGNGGPGYTIPHEINPKLIHRRGALAAARQGDNVNPEKASSGSQFYIVQGRKHTIDELAIIQDKTGFVFTNSQRELYVNVGGAPHLDGQYTVFGEVIEGMDVVDRISAAKIDGNNRPAQDIVMKMSLIAD
jgi:peptidyl-prolyl cis-trans isomerase B (cyclophilin B)